MVKIKSLSPIALSTAKAMVRAIDSVYRPCADTRTNVMHSRLSFDAGEPLRCAQDILDGQVSRVLIYGPKGSGKTTAAAMVIGELARLVALTFSAYSCDRAKRDVGWWNNAVMWIDAADLSTESEETPVGKGELYIAHKAKKAKVLVVDALGDEPNRFHNAMQSVVNVIGHRYRDTRKITILTTPLRSTEFAQRYGEDLYLKFTTPSDPRNRKFGQKWSQLPANEE